MSKIDFTTFHTSDKLFMKRGIVGVAMAVILRLRGVISLLVLTRLWETQEMGVYRLIFLTAALCYPVFSLSAGYGFCLSIAPLSDKKRIGEHFWNFFYATMVSMLIGIVALGLFWENLPVKMHFAGFWVIIAVAFSFILNKTLLALPIAFQRMRITTSLLVITEYGSLAAVLTLAWLDIPVEYCVLGYAAILLLVNLVTLILVAVDIGKPCPLNLKLVKSFIAPSLPIIPWKFSSLILLYMDQYFLKKFHGEAEVGIYSVAVLMASLLLGMEMFLSFSYNSAIIKFRKLGEHDKFKKYVEKAFRWFRLILALNAVFFYLFAKPLVQTLIGEKFHAAADILPLYAIAMSVALEGILIKTTLFSIRKPWTVLACTATAAAAGLYFYIQWIPAEGMQGAARATVAAFLIELVLLYAFILLSREFSLNFSSLARAILTAAPLVFIAPVMGTLSLPWDGLLLIPPTLIAYGFIIWFTGGLQPDEKSAMKSFAATIFRKK